MTVWKARWEAFMRWLLEEPPSAPQTVRSEFRPSTQFPATYRITRR